MNRYALLGGSIGAAALILLASMTTIVGYQTVQGSHQTITPSKVNEKDLLFQTIADLVNNRDLQKAILGSGITGKRLSDPQRSVVVFPRPALTQRFLNFAYHMGLTLTKTISKSTILSKLKQIQGRDQWLQKDIAVIVEKDTTLKQEQTKASRASCGCDSENTTSWGFPVLCNVILPTLFLLSMLLSNWAYYNVNDALSILFYLLIVVIADIAYALHCPFYYP